MKDAANDREHEENCHLHLRKKSLFSTKVLCRRLSEKEKIKMKTLWIWIKVLRLNVSFQ